MGNKFLLLFSCEIWNSSNIYSRNVNWSLQGLEWDNLFNYGEGNFIDFTKLEGIVGIFGKNYSGKSSIVRIERVNKSLAVIKCSGSGQPVEFVK